MKLTATINNQPIEIDIAEDQLSRLGLVKKEEKMVEITSKKGAVIFSEGGVIEKFRAPISVVEAALEKAKEGGAR